MEKERLHRVMVDRLDRHTFERQIKAAYRASGNDLGWRFLYSPEGVLDGAEVAFIGLNPGGTSRPADYAEFCMTEGSAYQRESWADFPPGQSPLQRQVLLLFERLGVRTERVLDGNLVPFRSPSWDRLPSRAQALCFGCSIWREVLGQARPSLVISMGRVTNEALAAMLGIKRPRRDPAWLGSSRGAERRFRGRQICRPPSPLPVRRRFPGKERRTSPACLRTILVPLGAKSISRAAWGSVPLE